ncbi:MAG: hypothetical protein JO199_09325 [Candidatus Eremiobacteraeota bacterium]|nr:hypothetical protein [Candidatus Eremiobacteraeota bacterium]
MKKVDSLPLPTVDGLLLTRPDLAVEWHYSVRQLCELMTRVASLPLMSVNPGVADPSAFEHVAYKGGSDTGIINLTTALTTKQGTKLCFSATLNDANKNVDDDLFERTYSSALPFLAKL